MKTSSHTGNPGANVRIGCSGWNYTDWREIFYPRGMGPSKWLSHYAKHYDTVEVNSTFYRLASAPAVARWLEQTPEDFLFTIKASRYLTHVKRLTDMERGVERFYASIDPLVGSSKFGPVLWQLPENFRCDVERLRSALEHLPGGRHCFEFRHASWFTDEVLALLAQHNVALVIGDHPDRDFQPVELTTNWTLIRLHLGVRGRRGKYSSAELKEKATSILALAEKTSEVLVYFNNDWEGFALANADELKRLLDRQVR